jgi:uncharacterized YigZ family protein
MDKFYTISKNVQAEIVEKKSRFIANLFYVEKTEQADEYIKQIRKKYFDAKHHCIAYRIVQNNQIIEKSSDDGEPSGTAGAPMLNILKNHELANILVIVTRYFGGTLLGTGGLVRAYSDSTIKAIESGDIIQKNLGEEIEVTLDYSFLENFKYYCKKNDINITKTDYAEEIVCRIELELYKKERLMSDFNAKKINLKDIKDLSIKYISKSKEK